MLPKHNKKKTKQFANGADGWNNDDEIPGKMYRLGEKKLEEESSRFMAARPTERQWRLARKLQCGD